MIERCQAHPVLLLLREVGERGSEITCVVEFGDRVCPEAHGLRDIEYHHEVGGGFRLEQLDVETIGASEEPPVDKPNIISPHVFSVFSEVEGHAEVGRPMEAL